MVQGFETYHDFFPYYVSQHSKPATRWIHFAGTHLGAAAAVAGLARGKRGALLRWPAVSYPVAWFAHFAIEHNRPATFGHPLWSLRGDFQMIAMMWQGRDAELSRIAADSLSGLAGTEAA